MRFPLLLQWAITYPITSLGIAYAGDIHLGRATLERSAVSTNTQLEATPTSVWWVPAQTKIQPRDVINYMEIQGQRDHKLRARLTTSTFFIKENEVHYSFFINYKMFLPPFPSSCSLFALPIFCYSNSWTCMLYRLSVIHQWIIPEKLWKKKTFSTSPISGG